MPDYYRPGQALPRVGAPGAMSLLDTNRPVHGAVCLRIKAPPRRYNRLLAYLAPQVRTPTPYVYSVYLRAEQEDTRVRLLWGWPSTWSTNVSVGTEWQRYSVSGMVQPELSEFNVFGLCNHGTVWIDAIQVEQGTEPTPFEP